MGFFDDIDTIDPSGKGNRFPAGLYPKLRIKACRVNQGHHGVRFILEAEVLESSGPAALMPGATGSWTVGIEGQYADMGKAEVKSMYLAAMGEDPTKSDLAVTKEDLQRVVGPENSLEGRIISTEAWDHTTKSGNAMVKHRWSPAEGAATAAAPTPPAAPAAPAPTPAAFPPSGWYAHPDAPGSFHNGTDVLTEAELRARVA